MRTEFVALIAAVMLAGCQTSEFDGPTVDDFDGRLVAGGQSVSFEPDEKVRLQLMLHANGERFGVPIQPDGSFDIGWMPIGTYSAVLEYPPKNRSANSRSQQDVRHSIPEGLEIVEGQTKYEIDLGKNWKR
ncbi:DUF3823 domain-containing protein [Blastopirellula retiformator]|uniref:Uncharacterized protein n=1 Tax=Blastopirellula retiformator TaxID=2527970 RepID=A0A5C5VLB0_9BACT|nr:DUF3823 domain-containing protein [Blastopirellula retiformator]TWT38605.1 hypothetical protein Enr8_02980 [Blastopirellula retiformator]